MRQQDQAQAAELLRRVLTLVDEGELSADGPAGVTLARRLEGALLALSAIESQADRGKRQHRERAT